VDENPKEGWGAFARSMGRNQGNSGNAAEGSAAMSQAGVGIVVADSVNDRGHGQVGGAKSEPEQERPAQSESGKAGWTSVKAGRLKAAITTSVETQPGASADDAAIPRSRLGRARSAEAGRAPRVRRARLKIVNIDPWSMMKVSFLFSVALGLVFLVAVALLWTALDVMGVFASVGHTVSDVSGGANSSGFNVVSFFSLPRVMGIATILALVNTIMITALATLASYLYNLSTELVGGLEMTLAEEE
jgi:hypothetical protein